MRSMVEGAAPPSPEESEFRMDPQTPAPPLHRPPGGPPPRCAERNDRTPWPSP